MCSVLLCDMCVCYCGVLCPIKCSCSATLLPSHFLRYDVNKDGTLGRDEVVSAMNELAGNGAEEGGEAGGDGDGDRDGDGAARRSAEAEAFLIENGGEDQRLSLREFVAMFEKLTAASA